MSDIEQRLLELNTWSRGGQRAPHKPLLVLWALARLQRGEPRMASWLEIEPALSQLLVDFGPARLSTHPEHPFWRLQKDSVWEVTGPAGGRLDVRENASGDVAKTALRVAGAMGGLPAPEFAALTRDPALVNRLVSQLVVHHFPPSLHDDLLEAVGMPYVAEKRFSRRRDPAFRHEVLQGYDYACAVCGLSLQLGGRAWGVEAAHVQWHANGGPDTFDNGLALCVLHHKALDRGAIGLDEQRRVVVSRTLSSSPAADSMIIAYHGQPLRQPQSGLPSVQEAHVRWHMREVFRGPAR